MPSLAPLVAVVVITVATSGAQTVTPAPDPASVLGIWRGTARTAGTLADAQTADVAFEIRKLAEGVGPYMTLPPLHAWSGKTLWETDVLGWAWGRPFIEGDTIYIGVAGPQKYVTKHAAGLVSLDRRPAR